MPSSTFHLVAQEGRAYSQTPVQPGKEGKESGAHGPFLKELHALPLLTSHSLEVGHMATPSCQGKGGHHLRWVALFLAQT